MQVFPAQQKNIFYSSYFSYVIKEVVFGKTTAPKQRRQRRVFEIYFFAPTEKFAPS
jgi:hypothetical protein